MNLSVRSIYEKYLKQRTLGIAIIVSMVAFSFAFSAMQQSNYRQAPLNEVMQINDQDIIIYLARNDCPDCKQVDALLKRNAKKLSMPVYRIETRIEENQSLLKQLIEQENIASVPTFLQKRDQDIERIEAKITQKNIAFQKLTRK